MNTGMTVNTRFNADEIRQELRDSDEIRGRFHEHIMNLRDQGVRRALEKLGWTPPGDESVQNQLCARIEELELEKATLADQLDRTEAANEAMRHAVRRARNFAGDRLPAQDGLVMVSMLEDALKEAR